MRYVQYWYRACHVHRLLLADCLIYRKQFSTTRIVTETSGIPQHNLQGPNIFGVCISLSLFRWDEERGVSTKRCSLFSLRRWTFVQNFSHDIDDIQNSKFWGSNSKCVFVRECGYTYMFAHSYLELSDFIFHSTCKGTLLSVINEHGRYWGHKISSRCSCNSLHFWPAIFRMAVRPVLNNMETSNRPAL
jgi:hypothetical protein